MSKSTLSSLSVSTGHNDSQLIDQTSISTVYDQDVYQDVARLPSTRYIESDLTVIISPSSQFPEVKMNFKLKGPRVNGLLANRPPQFDQAPLPMSGVRFEPFTIYAVCDALCKGVLPVYPSVFATYGINEDDWIRFIEDLIAIDSQMSTTRKIITNAGLSSYGGYQCYKYMMKQNCRNQYPKVKELVNRWNECYFEKRGIFILFQTPEDIWAVRQQQDPEFEVPKQSKWDFITKDHTKSVALNKARIIVFSKQ